MMLLSCTLLSWHQHVLEHSNMLLCAVASETGSPVRPPTSDRFLYSLYMVLMQHYAIKTIENIGSQAGDWATRFASSEVVSYLVTIWQGSKNDNIRATAASTLSRLMRHSSSLLAPALEKYSLKPVVQGEQTAVIPSARDYDINQSVLRPSFAPCLMHYSSACWHPFCRETSPSAVCLTPMSAVKRMARTPCRASTTPTVDPHVIRRQKQQLLPLPSMAC